MFSNFEYKGNWWIPEVADKQITGLLKFDVSGESQLELIGNLSVGLIYKVDKSRIILGISTEGKRITLLKSISIRGGFGSEINKYIFEVKFIFVGAHFNSEEQLVFNKIHVDIWNLSHWINQNGMTLEENFKDGTRSLFYSKPNKIEFSINDDIKGILGFQVSTKLSDYNLEYSLKQKSILVLHSTHPYKFSDLLNQAEVFIQFLSIATLEICIPLTYTLFSLSRIANSNGDSNSPIHLFFKHEYFFKKEKQNHPFKFLLKYNDISNSFQNIIQNWYSQREKLGPIINILYDSFNDNKAFTENSFLNIIQAVETFHRRFRKNEVMEKGEYKFMMNEIISSIPVKYEKWLKEKLAFGNEPSLQERLTEILTELNHLDIIKRIFDNAQAIIKKTKDSRNYYTHYNNRLKDKTVKGIEMYRIAQKWKLCLIILVLTECGLTHEEINKFINSNVAVQARFM